MTEFSIPQGCWTFRCPWGHTGSDFESDWEAQQAELAHPCYGGAA